MKLSTEENLGVEFGVEHPAFAWRVEHAADVLTKTELGEDGKTPWKRLKTSPYSGLMLEFGARVLLRVAQRPVGGEMAARWVDGV